MQHKVTVKGATIAVQEQGSGMPIIFLHGSPDTAAMWVPVIEQLKTRAHCYALDLPGFGDSTLPEGFSLTLDNMADFMNALLTELRITEPVVLVTTDFGGHYGPAFAVKYPDKVRGIAISNTNFFPDYQWHTFARLYRMPVMGELLMATSSKSVINRSIKGYAPAIPDDYINASYSTGFGSVKVRKTILRMYRERDSKDFEGWGQKLVALLKQKPSIILWGDRDPFITPNFAERFGAKQVHHFPEYSHWLPLEAPDAYVAKLAPWLDTL